MEKLYGRIEAFAKEKLKGEMVTGIDHALRVWRWCEILAHGEDVDMDVLHAAAFLHDISVPTMGRKTHYEDGARMAEGFLREIGYPEEKLSSVLHAIRAHSRWGGPKCETQEAKILRDSDVLEFLGAIGMVRGVLRGLEEGYKGDVSEAPALLSGTKNKAGGKFYTKKAMEIAEGRSKVMEKFITRLREELEFAK